MRTILLLLLCGAVTAQAQSNLRANLPERGKPGFGLHDEDVIRSWPMTGVGYNDVSYSASHGTPISSVLIASLSNVVCLSNATSGAYVSAANVSLLNTLPAAGTQLFWIKTSVSGAAFGGIISQCNGNKYSKGFAIAMNTLSHGITWFCNGTGAGQLDGTIAVNDGNWHCVVVTYSSASSGTVILYVDGVQDKSATNATAKWGNDAGADGYMIANRQDATTLPLTGAMRSVVIWKVTLTAAEVKQVYENSRP